MASPGPRGVDGVQEAVAEEHLRSIFDLCDDDGDGLVAVADLRRREEMRGYDKQMDLLMQTLDPGGQGRVSFDAFSEGIKTFLFTKALQKDDSVDSNTSEPMQSLVLEDTDSAFSNDDLHPTPPSASLCPAPQYELVTVGEEDGESSDSSEGHPLRTLQSTPLHSLSAGVLPKERDNVLMQSRISAHELGDSRRYRLLETLPLELPLGAESSLHSQVDELTSKLECAEQVKRSSLSRQRTLEVDIRELRERVYLLEDQLSEAQLSLEREHQDHERRRAEEMKRVRMEAAEELGSLRHSVERLGSECSMLRHSEADLRRRLEAAKEAVSCKGSMVVHLEAQLVGMERRISGEREEWRRMEQTSVKEREALQQALSESQSQQQLRAELECDTVSKRRSTASLDVDLTREIDHLNKDLDRLKEDNARLTASLLQQGQALVSPLHNSSLASELEHVSHEKLVGKLQESEQYCERLRQYIGCLLANVMDKHPELLEIHPT